MGKIKPKIIDADKFIGKANLNHDKEFADYETARKHFGASCCGNDFSEWLMIGSTKLDRKMSENIK